MKRQTQTPTGFAPTPEWIWRGGWKDLRYPFRAALSAPLIGQVPVILWIFLKFLQNNPVAVQSPSVFLLMLAAVLVGATSVLISFVLPTFLVLSWLGYAGLLPVLLLGTTPAVLCVTVCSEIHYKTGMEEAILLFGFLATGLFVAGGFWMVARGYHQNVIREFKRLVG